jgi:hypothetical protein
MDKRKTRPKAHVLGAKAFAAISAVEGLQLGATSRKRLDQMRGAGLSQDEKRALILRAYKATSGRK